MKVMSVLFLVAIWFALIWLTRYLLISENLYFNSLADQLTYEQITEMLANGKKWEWLSYVLVPVLLLIKFSLIALCLGTGLFLVTNRFEFGKMFAATVRAEYVFLIPAVFKLFWFLFVKTDYRLEDLQMFSPFSALGIVGYQNVETWLRYPLQVFNVFELAYCVGLAWCVSREIPRLNLNMSFRIVASGYGSGLAVWIVLMMFIMLTYS